MIFSSIKDYPYLCKKLRVEQKVMRKLHASDRGTHLWFLETYDRIKHGYFWENLKPMFKFWKCLVFQMSKGEMIKNLVIIEPLDILSWCWEVVSMDFRIGFPNQAKNIIMVVIDWLKKYDYFFSLLDPFKESIIASSFMEIA